MLGAIPLLGSLGIAIRIRRHCGIRWCVTAETVSGSLFAVGSRIFPEPDHRAVRQPAWHGVVVYGSYCMGQAFFSLSITGSGMIICSVPLRKDIPNARRHADGAADYLRGSAGRLCHPSGVRFRHGPCVRPSAYFHHAAQRYSHRCRAGASRAVLFMASSLLFLPTS